MYLVGLVEVRPGKLPGEDERPGKVPGHLVVALEEVAHRVQ